MLDALQAFGGESVQFNFNGKLEATMLQDLTVDDYIHIIMPLKS